MKLKEKILKYEEYQVDFLWFLMIFPKYYERLLKEFPQEREKDFETLINYHSLTIPEQHKFIKEVYIFELKDTGIFESHLKFAYSLAKMRKEGRQYLNYLEENGPKLYKK